MPTLHFETKPYKINDWIILRLPEEVSKELPSRGQVMVEGTVNGHTFKTPLEPDGRWSHWFKINDSLRKTAGVEAGELARLAIEPTKNWPEPDVPADIKKAVESDKVASELWQKITPMARWEWVRWIRATAKQETRTHRIEVALSKMNHGERRPCCWNRNLSTEPEVSKNGILLEPSA